jgi:nucleotide-binding universal stress UspA family protein
VIDAARQAIALFGGGQRVVLLDIVRPALVTTPGAEGSSAPTARLDADDASTPESVLAAAARAEAEAKNELDEALRNVELDPRIRVRAATGSPGESICQAALEERVDVTILGPQHRSRARRLVSGSTIDHVLAHAHCPVLVTRTTAGSEKRG